MNFRKKLYLLDNKSFSTSTSYSSIFELLVYNFSNANSFSTLYGINSNNNISYVSYTKNIHTYNCFYR